MHTHGLLFVGPEADPQVHPLTAWADRLKGSAEGLSRAPFFFAEGEPRAVLEQAAAGALPVSGPFIMTHAVRRAGDLLLDGIVIEGMTLGLEVEGRRFPELPAHDEVVRLLAGEKTFVIIDERQYRPHTEVFGFQQVYEETVRSIEALKALGVPQAAMMILATTEEISVELHPSLFAALAGPKLPALFQALLANLTGLRLEPGTVVKTRDRTIVPGVFAMGYRHLLPGAVHPASKRVKVQVGPSHFAYGPAAFSDYCSKKRDANECQKELRNYLKFLGPLTPALAVPKLEELLAGLKPVEAARTVAAVAAAPDKLARGGFRPLRDDIADCLENYPLAVPVLATPWPELNKLLCGGFVGGGLHVVIGGREEGKAALLLAMAVHWAKQYPVLLYSAEMTLVEVAQRLASLQHKTPFAELTQRHLAASGPAGEAGRKTLRQVLDGLVTGLPEGLYFRGAEGELNPYNLDELTELLRMLPGGDDRLLLVDGLRHDELSTRPDYLTKLRARLRGLGKSAILCIHSAPRTLANPHVLDADDMALLSWYQHRVDTVLNLSTDRAHHKRALAIATGKQDPEALKALETAMYQGAARLRQDTWLIARLLHRRYGARGGLLFLYQREMGRLVPGTQLPLLR